jgi:hypothetical protein
LDRLKITAAQVDKAGCAAPFNEVAQYFNRRLKEAVVQLRKDLPLAAITYVDVYSAKYSLISRANKHGKPLYPQVEFLIDTTHNNFHIWQHFISFYLDSLLTSLYYLSFITMFVCNYIT